MTLVDRAGLGTIEVESSASRPADHPHLRSHREPAPNRRQRIPVALVGTGYIASYHLQVLNELGIAEVVGACDPDPSRLEAMCRQWEIPVSAPDLTGLLQRCRPAAVHILAPPACHFELARAALDAGLHVLVEKPMALRTTEAAALVDLAKRRRLQLRVNHNAVHHPSFRRLLADVEAERLGRIDHVVSVVTVPLAQLESGDHDHWMFRQPENILFEQATHPLSQICELVGAVRDCTVRRSGARRLKTGNTFHTAWQVSLTCERGTAQLFMAFGGLFPGWTIQVNAQDGLARLDLLNNVCMLDRATKYLEPVDRALRSLRAARDATRDGSATFLRYILATLRLGPRNDAYYASMRHSIAAFYDALREGPAPADGASDGLRVVAACDHVAQALRIESTEPIAAGSNSYERQPTVISAAARSRIRHTSGSSDEILVLGGSGFIGQHILHRLARLGPPVRVMSRRAPSPVRGHDAAPTVVKGDIRRIDDVERAVEGCRSVIHLVSGAADTWADYERYIDGTRQVAQACVRAGVEQLLFASSIAVFYLGNPHETITEETPLDDRRRRAPYTRAKIACEQLLMQIEREHGLRVTILRPGVVVGAGGPFAHLGVGFWPTPTHCIRWGADASQPLPFVLVDDVADAFVSAIGRSGVDGQSFNLVGDVRLSAAEYIEALRAVSRRDIQLHRQALLKWYGIDLAKWGVKAIARRAENPLPSYRDFASWTLRSSFDCSRAKRTLGWKPVADRERFIELAIRRALGEEFADQ